MSRFLTNLKFWVLTACLLWIGTVVFFIADHPELAGAAK